MTRNQFRFASFEALEPRLVMSAQALTDFVSNLQPYVPSDQIDQQIELVTQSESLDSHSGQLQDLRNQFDVDGTGQTIAVIDSGIAFDHAALGGGFGTSYKIVGGYDFAENDSNPYDDGPVGLHGTHVAGIIGAESDEFVGIAPGADLVSLRVFDDTGFGDLSWVEQALQWVHENRNAFENPITTVNLSLGTDWNADTLPDPAQFENEFAQLKADGIFISVAAGNLFNNYLSAGLSYPAASPYVVPVASHGDDGSISDFSQRNERVLVAPGESILSTVPEHMFGGTVDDPLLRASGTSQSAPYVAGASALLRDAFQDAGRLDIDQDLLYQHFRETADVILDQATGGYYHRINLQRAIEAAYQHTGQSHQQPANEPFYVQDGVLYVNGTADNDQIYFGQGQVLEVVVNNQTFSVNSNSISHVKVIGGAGTDSITVSYQGEVERAVLQANRVDITGASLEFTARGFEQVSLDAGQHADRLVVRDSSGNDQIFAGFGQITISGSGFEHEAIGFAKIQVVASAGNDTIEMRGHDGDDRFVSKDGRNVLRSGENRIVARGFDNTTVVATAGHDIANLFDTDGDDRFVLAEDSFQVLAGNLEIAGAGFSRIHAHSDTGFDKVELKGSHGQDRLLHRDGKSRLQGEGFVQVVNGFDQTFVWGKAGTDTARIYGTDGNDQFQAHDYNTEFHADSKALYTGGFDIVDVFADLAGTDSAILTGTKFHDSVLATVDTTRLQNAFGVDVAVHGFDQVFVDTGGGYDNTQIVGGEGIDLLKSLEQGIEYHSIRQMLTIIDAESHVFDGNGGYDEAIFSDFEELDLLTALGSGATAKLNSRTVDVVDIEFLEASTRPGETGLYEIDAVDFLFLLDGEWEQAAE